MNVRRTSSATWLLLLGLVVACSKGGTTESRPSEAPAPPVQVADAATSAHADAAGPDALAGFGKDNASGAQLGSAVDADLPQRNPARDLNEQLGGGAQPTDPRHPPHTRVTLSSHRALGPSSLDSSKIAGRYMGAGQAAVRRCYEGVLAHEPATTGTLTLQFAVTPTGHVVDATAESWNPALSKCVLDAMPTWTFSTPKAQARFELVLSLVVE